MKLRYIMMVFMALLVVGAANTSNADLPGSMPDYSNIFIPDVDEVNVPAAALAVPSVPNIRQGDVIPTGGAIPKPTVPESIAELNEKIRKACEGKPEGCIDTYLRPNEDDDKDMAKNSVDNCPVEYNASQSDSDDDGFGDSCDVCPYVSDPDQTDSDGDGFGDACLNDTDGDGVLDKDDQCPREPEKFAEDGTTPADGELDGCDNSSGPNESKNTGQQQDFLYGQAEGGCSLMATALPSPSNIMQSFLAAFALAGLVLGRASRK